MCSPGYYEIQDVHISTYRDMDLKYFSDIIAHYITKIVLLHGQTECWKASFLRVNVIPFLEKPEHGFQFLKTTNTKPQKTLFIRATHAPLIALSKNIFDFISKDHKIKTPVGEVTLDLSKATLGYEEVEEFRKNTGKSPEKMLDVLMSISGVLPKTLVIIIDQAEEVLTIKRGAGRDTSRSDFFRFLSLFSKAKIDMKMLVTLKKGRQREFYKAIRKYGLKRFNKDELGEEII